MNTRALTLFAEVAHHGSFAQVAKMRDIDPSSVSRAIGGLEADLGLRLFQRTTRAMRLTEAGELYLARAMPLIAELERIGVEARKIRTTPAGTLRLTASVTFGQRRIVPLLGVFRRRYPDIHVECLFTDANVDLVGERIDLAVRLAPAITGDVVVSKLMDTRYRVVASPAYLATADAIGAPDDLVAHPCLMFHLPGYRNAWRFRARDGAERSVPVTGPLTLSPAGSVRDAALGALGPALLADWLIEDDLAAGRLVDVLPEWQASATDFDTAAWLVYPSRSYLPAKTRVTIDFLREMF